MSFTFECALRQTQLTCWECERDANDLVFYYFWHRWKIFWRILLVYRRSSVRTAGTQQVYTHHLAFRIPRALVRLAKAHSVSDRRAAEEDRIQAVVAVVVAAGEEDSGSRWSASCRS